MPAIVATRRCKGYRSCMSSEQDAKKDWHRWLFYITLAALGFGPLLLGWILGDNELVRRVAETPAVVGLVTALAKILTDANERTQVRAETRRREDREDELRRHEVERAKLTQQLEHAFAIGSSSHMANVAFDKHVQFCEDYAKELRATLSTLWRNGPTEEVLPHASALVGIREAQALWLTPEIDGQLEEIEKALRAVGSGDHRIRIDNSLAGEARQEQIRMIFQIFFKLVGLQVPEELQIHAAFTEKVAVHNVIRGLGRVLGVDELTRLRLGILRNAVGLAEPRGEAVEHPHEAGSSSSVAS